MKKLYTLFIALIFLSVSLANAQQYKPIKILPNTFFKGGEKLTLQLRYGFIIGGNVTLELTESNDLLHIKGTAKTTGLADKLFSVKDVYESYFMNSNNLPVFAIQNVKEGKKYTYYNEVKFNHALKKVTSTKSGDHDVPEGIVDMMSVFYMIRRLDLSEAKEGDIYKINTFFSDKLFPFELRYRGKETIETPLGKIRCIKFAPIVEPGRVFKSKDDMFIWFTDDENRLPVLIAMEMLVGSVNCEMIKCENVVKEPAFKK